MDPELADEDYDAYLDHKQRKWEQKQDYRAAKEALKDEKYGRRFYEEGRYWTHVDEPVHHISED